MKAYITAALVFLSSSLALAQDETTCGPSAWFRTTKVSVKCPIGNPQQINVLIPWAPGYITQGETDPRLQKFKEQSNQMILEVEHMADDLDKERIPLAGHVSANHVQAQIDIPFKALGDLKAIHALRLVFPADTFFCGKEEREMLVPDETALDLQLTDLEGKPLAVDKCVGVHDNDATRPLDWDINVAPADDDTQDDPGLAVDFNFNKVWGYGFKLDPSSLSWASNLWRVKLSGTGATNDADFYDSVSADLSLSRNRSYVGDGITGKPFTAYWWGGYVRPETTFSDDTRDYVFGARMEVLANLKTLIGTDIGRGPKPYLALSVERVDPDKREDGTVPSNYERATGDFLWKFSPFGFNRIQVEAGWEAKYILDKDDLAELGLDDRLQDKLEISVGLDVTGKREFLPFLKYTRGSEAPRFDVVEEVLFGLLWNRLAPGELQQ